MLLIEQGYPYKYINEDTITGLDSDYKRKVGHCCYFIYIGIVNIYFISDKAWIIKSRGITSMGAFSLE